MAARPRIRKRAHFPPNLHEPRPGYFTWRDPRDGKTHVIGRVPTAQAIHEAIEANVVAEKGLARKSLAERVGSSAETIADLVARMPLDGYKKSSLYTVKSAQKIITDGLGHIRCDELTAKDVAGLLEEMKARGVQRMAQVVRSRLMQVCLKGVALGWMQSNPVEVTEKIRVKVRRRRLTLETFQAVLAKAPEVLDYLENAMLLALVTGQDRSTIARWERSAIQGDVIIASRAKTGVQIAIPLSLRMDAIGMSVADVLARCKGTGIVSRYLLHQTKTWGPAKRGSQIRIGSLTTGFQKARELAGITGDDAPTFHEIRSLSKRLYDAQGGVDTKALLGHMSDATAAIYANSRGIEPMKVRVSC
ncbi:tyrosine-type recombinase/integrase [Cupriavidus gilardii]|uniref:tyrosine-type recombinase/integrase n=1 Tax=Cupriavidus gilardii TaxID=82541 RepID=UPI0021B45AE1|nr:tyrosine-type recombinase/integrase [Cupriavidus gilardii]UXC38233.1 phage integrase Arm DNA-binding domain-containing protein [Cupriavidus gilardii]